MFKIIFISAGFWIFEFLFVFFIMRNNVKSDMSTSIYYAFILSFLGIGVLFIISVVSYFYIRAVCRCSDNPLIKKSAESFIFSKDLVLGVKRTNIKLILIWRCKIQKINWFSVVFLCKTNRDNILKKCKYIRVRKEHLDQIIMHINELNKDESSKIAIKEIENPDLCAVEKHAINMQIAVRIAVASALVIVLLCRVSIFIFIISIVLGAVAAIFIAGLIEIWLDRQIVDILNQTVFAKNQEQKE